MEIVSTQPPLIASATHTSLLKIKFYELIKSLLLICFTEVGATDWLCDIG